MSSFPERESDDGSKLDRLRSYIVALEGFSADVLEDAERMILKAKAPDIDPRFMPTPPQLAKLCTDIRASKLRRPVTPQEMRLERFDTPPDPKLAEKFKRVQRAFAKEADRIAHETRGQWMDRMGDRIKRLA